MVIRIFVNPAIKKALCREAGAHRDWLAKIRPWWYHEDHFHVRLACPSESDECKAQPLPPADEGSGYELDYWIKKAQLVPKRTPRGSTTQASYNSRGHASNVPTDRESSLRDDAP